MIVLGIAAGILVLFGVLAAVSGQGTDKPTGTSGPTSVKGTSLLAVPAARALKPIERPGTPPDNIVDALTLPQGSVAGSVKDDNTSATQYDEQMQFSVKASEDTVVNFYKAQLKTDGVDHLQRRSGHRSARWGAGAGAEGRHRRLVLGSRSHRLPHHLRPGVGHRLDPLHPPAVPGARRRLNPDPARQPAERAPCRFGQGWRFRPAGRTGPGRRPAGVLARRPVAA